MSAKDDKELAVTSQSFNNQSFQSTTKRFLIVGSLFFLAAGALGLTPMPNPMSWFAEQECQRKAPNSLNSTNHKEEVDFGPYMARMQRRIKAHWHPPKGNLSRRAVVVFGLRKDGALIDAHIAQSSHVESMDKSALDAIEAVAPFEALPPGAESQVNIRFSFDYNVFDSKTASSQQDSYDAFGIASEAK